MFRPKLFGTSFEDYLWRDVASIHMKESFLGATVTVNIVGGKIIAVDCLPKAQARKLYAFGQAMEEKMLEHRRERELEDKRAAAGGVIVHGHVPAAPPASVKDDPMEILGKLKTMLDRGLISQADYDSKKAEVMSRL